MINHFPPALFWDIDISTLSEENHAAFIIQRVSSNGSWKDWNALLNFYGIEKIKNELLHARYLDNKSLAFFSTIFNIPKEDFRCYTMKQSTRERENF